MKKINSKIIILLSVLLIPVLLGSLLLILVIINLVFNKSDVNTKECLTAIQDKIFTAEYDSIVAENKDDYLIEYKDDASEEYKEELTDLIIRIFEYQRESLLISTEDFEYLYILIDVYFDESNFAYRDSGGVSEETFAAAYVTSFGNMVLYVDPDISLSENVNLYNSLSHELVHLIQYDYYKDKTSLYDEENLPRWYLEGMAMNNEFCLPDPQTISGFKKFEDLDVLQGSFFSSDEEVVRFAYRESFVFYNFLQKKYGEEVLIEFMDVPVDDFYQNAEYLLGCSLFDLYEEWKSMV